MQKQILVQISSLSLQEEAVQTQTNQKVKLNDETFLARG